MKNRLLLSGFLTLFLASHILWAKVPLSPESPLSIPGKVGRFDFMEMDPAEQRVLAAHKGAGNLVILDLKQGSLLPSIPVGHVQGIAVASGLETYVVGDEDEHKVVFINSKTLKKTGELAVDGPVDAVAFDAKNGMAYADEDDGSKVWVIDVKKKRLVTTITIPGVPEVAAYDSATDRIYQNIKNKDSVVVINPTTNTIEAQWSSLPAKSPHGLVIDSQSKRAFVAGGNGNLVGIDLTSGKVVSHVEIAPGTDQIAFDSESKNIYCASKGFISVVKSTDSGLESMGNVPDHAGAHTIAVDPSRHEAWISFADNKKSFLQGFKVANE